MPDPAIKRALLSVSDKTDLIPFAKALTAMGVEIISTGGTARALEGAGVKVTHVADVTSFPEMLDGRVKTLHPAIHGGLLAVRGNAEHEAALKEHGIEPIDLICINLYPFERTAATPGANQGEVIEQIDIGGPAMIRSASKNFASVTVVTSATQYDRVIGEMKANKGATTLRLRSSLASHAFARTCEYDAAIASYLSRHAVEAFPDVLQVRYTKKGELRYGENPHQSAALYADPASIGQSVVSAEQLHGKPLSYNNILDAAAALELVKNLRKLDFVEKAALAGVAIVKHTNPCGCAVAKTAADAFDHALAGDPLAAYGGILALSTTLDPEAAERISADDRFFEVIVAPAFHVDALDKLRARWANVRLLQVGDRPGSTARKLDYRSIPGGMLVQDRDNRATDPTKWAHAAGPEPTEAQVAAGAMLMSAVRALSSNAVAIGGPTSGTPGASGFALFGAGAGQMDRLASCRIAAEKAGERASGAVAASDAFFPFPDGPAILVDAGVKTIVHPGGSKRDQETFDLCNERGVTCLTTGQRHFRH
jgi:phosphoribosylaminoimidazolecarboxamide formyltransferase/IMP cyclohydrolase